MMFYNKAIPLVVWLQFIWLVIQCEALVSKSRCLDPDCDTVKQQTHKFYCVATSIYEELKTVSNYTMF